MQAKRRAVALALVGGVTLLAAPARAEAPDPLEGLGPRVRQIVGERALQVIGKATRAEVFRLRAPRFVPWDPPALPPGTPTIDGYQIDGQARPLDATIFDAFRETLLDHRTYTTFDSPRGVSAVKGCGGFRPGVAVRFWASIDRKPAHADALLCFQCSDIAIVSDRAHAPVHERDMSAGEIPLLRLAAAALPDDAFLANRLAERQAKQLVEGAFLGAFPARVQVELLAPHGDVVALLRKELPGRALFVAAARALGASRTDSSGAPVAVGDVVQAVRELSSQHVSAGMAEIATDQVALAGVSELLTRGALDDKVPPPLRVPWMLTTAEAAIVQTSLPDPCPLMRSLAKLPDAKGRRLLLRVASGELPAAPRPWTRHTVPASARACAFMALVEVSPDDARGPARAWHPSAPIDQAAAKAVLFRIDRDAALDPSVFDSPTPEVSSFVLDGIGARPTRASLDVLVARAIGHESRGVADRAEMMFSQLTGVSLAPLSDKDGAERTAFVRAWWQEHATTWQPPRPAPRP